MLSYSMVTWDNIEPQNVLEWCQGSFGIQHPMYAMLKCLQKQYYLTHTINNEVSEGKDECVW